MPDELREAFAAEMAKPEFEFMRSLSAKDERKLAILSYLYGD